VLVAAAVYAGTGHMNIAILAVVAIAAAVLGDNIGYMIGQFGGEHILHRYGKYFFLTPKKLERTKQFFDRSGGLIVIVARFIDGLRQLNGIIAGIVEMSWQRFLICNIIGTTLWVGTWLSAGYVAGDNIGPIYSTIMHYVRYLIIGLLVIAVGTVAWFFLRRRSQASIRRKR
jgi:membrane protein DedA with SNARE-associated domain